MPSGFLERSPKWECRGAPLQRQVKKGPDKDITTYIYSNLVDVHTVKTSTIKSGNRSKFDGICIDTGAQRSVVGLKQAHAYCQLSGVPFKKRPSMTAFRFGDGTFQSLGSIPVRIPTPDGKFISIEMDVVQADVPMLIGLEVLDRERLIPDNVANKLRSLEDGWSLPITRKYGHLYVEWDFPKIWFSKEQIRKLHLQFYHPSADKLFRLIQRAKPGEATSETKKMLEDINRACTTCQRYTPKPFSFQVSMPKGIVFNHELALDLMYLERLPVLHVVDTQTHFSSATFLYGESVEAVWYAFLECWVTLYPGYPDKMRTDQGTQFKSPRWKELTDATGIQLILSGVESHNSIGPGERYHAPLRRIYQKIRYDFPNLNSNITLRIAVKAMNDTMNPEGLVPSYLVFGIIPRLTDFCTELPTQSDRLNAIEVARSEMERIISEIRLRHALNTNIPPASKQDYKVGQKVLVYREKENPPWQGPYTVTKIENKQIFIDRNGKEVQHSISQIKHFVDNSSEAIIETLHCLLGPYLNTIQNPNDVYLTETLHPTDPRAMSPRFMEAKKREINGLMNKNTWKVIDQDIIPKNANILSGRFVLSIKNANTDEESYKARYVVQGHKDREKSLLVHNSTTVRQSSTRLIMALAATFGFRIWSQDVKQAYLQSSENLMRQIFLKPSKEFGLPSGKFLKLQKPLYGLADSGDYWYNTMSKHIRDDLEMKSTTGDISLFFKTIGNDLVGLTGTYVDDSLSAGTPEFENLTSKTMEMFESRDREMDSTKFAGVNIQTTAEGFDLDQIDYISKMTLLSIDCTFTEFRSKRAQLSWITHTRPEICCAVNMAAQVTEKSFTIQKINDLNKVIKHLRRNPSQVLRFHKLDKASLKLKVYADSSFANNDDFTSQLGYIILLTDKTDRCNIIHYSSHKSRRVTRSVLGGEVYAFADAFDFAFTLKHDLQVMLCQKIPLTILTDSNSLFDVITKSSTTSERRLMIDITAVRNAYNDQELSDVGFVRTKYNPADAFTKLGSCEALNTIIQTGICKLPIEQWVIRGNEAMLHTQSSEEGGV